MAQWGCNEACNYMYISITIYPTIEEYRGYNRGTTGI